MASMVSSGEDCTSNTNTTEMNVTQQIVACKMQFQHLFWDHHQNQ